MRKPFKRFPRYFDLRITALKRGENEKIYHKARSEPGGYALLSGV